MSKTIPNIDDDWVEDFKMKLITLDLEKNIFKFKNLISIYLKYFI